MLDKEAHTLREIAFATERDIHTETCSEAAEQRGCCNMSGVPSLFLLMPVTVTVTDAV